MIWESHPWREELCMVADRLAQWSESVDWDDPLVAFEIERDVMVSAFAIRKLREAHKLADSTLATRFQVEAIPLIDRVPDYMNWDRLIEFYDFGRARSKDVGFETIYNQLIHSFVFVRESAISGDDPAGDRGGLAGFFVASDHARSRLLYRIHVEEWIRALRLVGNEEVVGTRAIRDASGQWRVSNLTAADMEIAEPAWQDSRQSLRGGTA